MKKIAGLAHFKKNIPPDADDKTKNNTKTTMTAKYESKCEKTFFTSPRGSPRLLASLLACFKPSF